MTVPSASPLFLREAEIRRGIELLYFGYLNFTETADATLERQGLGRAHHRALYFIAQSPEMPVGDLLKLLRITKQSLGRVLGDLSDRGYLQILPGLRDRRQRLLKLTDSGAALEAELFEALRTKMTEAYSEAGQGSVTGFWRVLESLIPADQRSRLPNLGNVG
ncbi:MAG: MarR family transcriptional regulator [Sphingomonadaceae bacterium]